MARCGIPVSSRPRRILEDITKTPDDVSVFTSNYCYNGPDSDIQSHEFPKALDSSISSDWSLSKDSSALLVPIMAALIDDLKEMSDELSEIQSDIKSLGLSKMSPELPSTPRFCYTPATPDLNNEEQDVVELEDWEIEQKLKEMAADVSLMYLDLVEMSEEGYFPDGIPLTLMSEHIMDEGPALEPEDVMRILCEMGISELLEKGDEEWSQSSSSEVDAEEDLLESDAIPRRLSNTWSDFGSCPSFPTASESGEDVESLVTPSHSDHSFSIVDEAFIQSFHIAVSPLSRIIRSHSPQTRTKRPRMPSHCQSSPTMSFAPAPYPKSENFTYSPSFFSTSMFSEPTPLLPFSLPPEPTSPLSSDSRTRNSLWNKLLNRRKSSESSRNSSSSDLSSFKKIFSSPAKRTNSAISVDPVYDTTSVIGMGCMSR